MLITAHVGHWALAMLEFAPVLVVLVFAVWKMRSGRPAVAPES